jgi:hypothetical protein
MPSSVNTGASLAVSGASATTSTREWRRQSQWFGTVLAGKLCLCIEPRRLLRLYQARGCIRSLYMRGAMLFIPHSVFVLLKLSAIAVVDRTDSGLTNSPRSELIQAMTQPQSVLVPRTGRLCFRCVANTCHTPVWVAVWVSGNGNGLSGNGNGLSGNGNGLSGNGNGLSGNGNGLSGNGKGCTAMQMG